MSDFESPITKQLFQAMGVIFLQTLSNNTLSNNGIENYRFKAQDAPMICCLGYSLNQNKHIKMINF